MKRFYIIAVFLFPLFLNAQKELKNAEIFCAVDESSQNAIRVKWLYKTIYHPDGFDIYRQEKGKSDWTKINNQPVKLQKTLPSGNKLDKESVDLHKAAVETNYQEFSSSIIRAFVLIKAIYNNELADYMGISILDNQVSKGKEYQYKVCIAGNTDFLAVSKSIVVSDYAAPSPPEEIRLTRTKKRVDISWKPDIYRYYAVDVYRRTSDDTSLVKITKVPRAIQKDQAEKYSEYSIFYQDTAIDYNANYLYRFVAIDYFGNKSGYSPEYSAPAADFIPPSVPFDIVPTSSSLNSVVRIDWKVVDESDLAGIYIYWSDKPDKKPVRINKEIIPKTTLTYNHTNVPVGSNYYWVTTADLAGNESFGAPFFIDMKDVTPPAKPTGLQSESGEGYISLKWNPNTEPDLKGYHVQRSLKIKSEINSSYINVNKEPIKETYYKEQLPKNVRNEFVYRIVAIDTSFNRSIPSDNTLAKMPDVTPPLRPVIKSVVADTLSAKINWLSNVDVDLAGYNLYRSFSGDSLSLAKININLIPADLTIYTDRDISQGKSYDYYLAAVDSSGNMSPKSAGFNCITPEKKVKGSIKINSKKYNAKKNLLRLEWNAEISEEIRGCVIYCQTKPELPFKPITGMLTENYADISIGSSESGLYYIKCYTKNGKIVQSETFSVQNEKTN